MAEPSSKSNLPIELKGKLLLADPSLRDGVFDHSVILLTHHQHADGAAGFILNHPTGKLAGEFLKGDEFAALRQLEVHHGGPVASDQMTFASFWWQPKSGLRWSVRITAGQAAAQMRMPGRIVRAFIGYAGWSAGQLESELARTSWFPLAAARDLLGHPHQPQLWSELMRRISPFHRILAEAPRDPSLN
ncbi:MAG: YqgE/AlgH family protein [Verrucomicrobia bacterium]|nr:YqgE/AlgH family protein [Verrucomicrobiota bacterium]